MCVCVCGWVGGYLEREGEGGREWEREREGEREASERPERV